jgi:hypothetical protein
MVLQKLLVFFGGDESMNLWNSLFYRRELCVLKVFFFLKVFLLLAVLFL